MGTREEWNEIEQTVNKRRDEMREQLGADITELANSEKHTEKQVKKMNKIFENIIKAILIAIVFALIFSVFAVIYYYIGINNQL